MPLQLNEEIKRGKYSRLADDVRRNLASFKVLKVVTVSQNAPEWRREAKATDPAPKGLETILRFDVKGFKEVHYKTGTNGHRAKVFVR